MDDGALFHAKGLVYQGAREFYDLRVPGGAAAVRDALGDAEVAAFFDQRFLAGGWYDVMPILPIAAAAAHVAGVPRADFIRDNARWVADRDLHGIYKLIVSMASAQLIAERLPALSMRYFDFGDADGKMVRDNVFEAHRYGVPAKLAEWMALVTSGFVPVALAQAGAKHVRVRWGVRQDGSARGVPLVRIRFEVSWD
jgi:hypothetical protein